MNIVLWCHRSKWTDSLAKDSWHVWDASTICERPWTSKSGKMATYRERQECQVWQIWALYKNPLLLSRNLFLCSCKISSCDYCTILFNYIVPRMQPSKEFGRGGGGGGMRQAILFVPEAKSPIASVYISPEHLYYFKRMSVLRNQ